MKIICSEYTRLQKIDRHSIDGFNTTIRKNRNQEKSIISSKLKKDFRSFVDKLKHKEITRKLGETESLKIKFVSTFPTSTLHINSIHDSDKELAEKITQTLNIYKKNSSFEEIPYFTK